LALSAGDATYDGQMGWTVLGKGASVAQLTKYINGQSTNINRVVGASGEALVGVGLLNWSGVISAFNGLWAWWDHEVNTLSPVYGPTVPGYRDVDLSFTTDPRHSNFNLGSVYNPILKTFSTKTFDKKGGPYTFYVQVKAISATKFAANHILHGFEQITPENGAKQNEFPILVVDKGAWDYAWNNADADMKAKMLSAYEKFAQANGQLLLIQNLTKDAKNSVDKLATDIRNYYGSSETPNNSALGSSKEEDCGENSCDE